MCNHALTHNGEGVGRGVALQEHVDDLGVTLLGGLVECRVAELVLSEKMFQG